MLSVRAAEEIDVLVMEGGAGQHHTVRMKRRGRHRCRPGMEEAGGRGLDAIQEGTIDVEEVDMVGVGATNVVHILAMLHTAAER